MPALTWPSEGDGWRRGVGVLELERSVGGTIWRRTACRGGKGAGWGRRRRRRSHKSDGAVQGHVEVGAAVV